jgi:hypothetical protein
LRSVGGLGAEEEIVTRIQSSWRRKGICVCIIRSIVVVKDESGQIKRGAFFNWKREFNPVVTVANIYRSLVSNLINENSIRRK